MEILDKKSLNEAFLNVRKAYRLLFDYQTKLLNLAKFIGDRFSYSYYGGWPLYSASCPKPGKGSLGNWAWDWLNMYSYAFYFGSKQINEENVFFEVRIYSDTGYYDSQEKKKLDLNTYIDVNKSATKLVLIACNLGWDPNKLLQDFKSETTEYKLKDDNNNIVAKSYDLSDFLNEEESIRKLDDFIEYCKSNEIYIK